MQSPFTGGATTLRYEKKEFEFRKEKFIVTHFYYRCEDTKEEFTNDELDLLNANQLYNQYREKYCIPFPDEIKAIRDQYDISASKMSEILGLGTNSYRQYEASEMPTVSNGRLILAAKDPDEFKKFLEASRAVLNPKEFEKFSIKIDELIEFKRKNRWEQLFIDQIFSHSKPSEFTGYRIPSLEKITHTISYFATHVDYLWKTKLNKLLFYSDFLHYKRTGYSICGLAYRAIQLGPVPAEYDKLYVKLLDDNQFDVVFVPFKENGYVGEALKNKIDFDKQLFTDIELKVLDEVAGKLASKTSTEIVDISHKEKAWIENENKHEIISYQKYAFDLSAV
jgi:transcriptional regulator with XRE-family HTH domain